MRTSLLCLALIANAAISAFADPLAELAHFSVFDKVDLAQLANGEPKTSHGPPMSNGRYLSVQSVYVTPVSPAEHFAALRSWDPTEHGEPKVFLHSDISGSINENAFARIKSAPNNPAVRAFVSATGKMSNELQLSRDEATRWKGGDPSLSSAGGDFWIGILAGRARAFVSGGSSALAPYDHAGGNIRAGEELAGLLREQPKIRSQFGSLLDSTAIGRGNGSLKPALYWELLNADNVAVASLGAFYSRTTPAMQAADAFYYSSGGYYATLTLFQMWPVDVNGKPATLVWRGDMVSSASLADLHGVERLGAESAMMKSIGRSISLFRRAAGR